MRPFTPPPEGICGHCEQTLPIRKDGCIKNHPVPYDPDGPIHYRNCLGSGRPPAIRLDMTFARWLHAHVARRDYRTNPITFLAQWMFRPCSRTRKTPTDVTWSSPKNCTWSSTRPPASAVGSAATSSRPRLLTARTTTPGAATEATQVRDHVEQSEAANHGP